MIVIQSPRARRALRVAIPGLLMPLLAVSSGALLAERYYPLLILLCTAASLALFAAGFERRKTGARRLALVCVMTALAVVGRFIPFLKPIAAVTILTALALGGEAGFLVGALTALISNFYFGQGPWTPFQMLAFGLIGLAAGALRARLKKSRPLLLLYGALAGAAYSWMMDVWTVLWYDGGFTMALYRAALLSALPYTVLYAASNVLFLAVFASSTIRKLDRLVLKYDL